MVETARRAFAHTYGTGAKFLGLVLATILYLSYPPASWVLDVRSVRIQDSVAGVPPLMEVDRVIGREFRGDWTVTVMKKGRRGFSATCIAHGSSDYRPDAVIPDDLDLDWWTWPTKCPLAPGTYLIKTLWVIHLPIFPDKEVRNTSNVFEVR